MKGKPAANVPHPERWPLECDEPRLGVMRVEPVEELKILLPDGMGFIGIPEPSYDREPRKGERDVWSEEERPESTD